LTTPCLSSTPHLVSFKIYQLELNEGLGFLLDLLCCSALRHISIIYVNTVLWQSQFKAFFLDCHALWTMLTCREQPVEQCDFLCPNPVVLILHRVISSNGVFADMIASRWQALPCTPSSSSPNTPVCTSQTHGLPDLQQLKTQIGH